MFKLLFKYSKNYKKDFFIAAITIIFESILELACPYLMSLLLKYGIVIDPITSLYSIDIKMLSILSSLMILFGILAFIFGFIFAKYCAKYTKELAYEIRKEEYRKLSTYSFKNLDNISSSSLLTRLTNDVQIISDTISTSFRPMFRAPVMVIGVLIIAIITSPTLSICFAIAVPIFALIMFFIIKTVRPRFIKIQNIVDKMNKNTKETIVSIKTIKSYVKEDYEKEKFNKINDESRKTSNRAMSINVLMMPAQELILYATTVGLLYLGGYLALSDTYASIVINISMFLTYVSQILATVQMLTNVILQFNRANASVTRINEVFSVESEIIDNKNSKEVINKGSIEFKNVYFSYFNNDKYVIDNASFKIDSGEFIGIIGQTGSSKTTLINLILRFYDVTKGEILLDNKTIKSYSLSTLRKSIAVSFQSPFLFNDTVLNNIKWGNKDASMDEVIKATKIACCYDFIVNDLKDGFNTILSEGGNNLSGGQRQRICLARSLLLNPKILILDDSFSALDRITESKVKENLKRECQNMTKIVISQKISTIMDCDKIIVLEKGKITNIGNHEYLKRVDEIYQDINNIQNEGL